MVSTNSPKADLESALLELKAEQSRLRVERFESYRQQQAIRIAQINRIGAYLDRQKQPAY